MKRYFLVSYTAITKEGNLYNGNAYITTQEGFLNNKFTKEYLEDKNNLKDVVIATIFEFKSEEDYNTFIK